MQRIEDLSQQNTLLHEEAEKLTARVLTLQERGREGVVSPEGGVVSTPVGMVSTPVGVVSASSETSSGHLWEVIRSVCCVCVVYLCV